MGIEESGLSDALVESAEEDNDWENCPCPGCKEAIWLRLVAVYGTGTCWVVYCGGCGKTIQKQWNFIS